MTKLNIISSNAFQVHHVGPFAVDGDQELLQLPPQEGQADLQHCESCVIVTLNFHTKTIYTPSNVGVLEDKR